MKLSATPHQPLASRVAMKELLEEARKDRAFDLEYVRPILDNDKVEISGTEWENTVAKREDFLPKRREAAISELLKRHPDSSPERDPVLLRVLGRECRNSEEMAPYRHLLHSEDSKCEEKMMYQNGVALSEHPYGGKNFEELGQHLDKIESVLPIIRELARPLPSDYHVMHRRTKSEHKEAEAADGKFTFDELYTRGFPNFISAIYASDDPKHVEEFGPAKETLEMDPTATFIDGVWPDLEPIAMELVGAKGSYPVYDLYYKAGIDVCLYKEMDSRGGGWVNIYNPEVINSVS